jgi:hypothetical protein
MNGVVWELDTTFDAAKQARENERLYIAVYRFHVAPDAASHLTN